MMLDGESGTKELFLRISKGARRAHRYEGAFVIWTVVLVVATVELLGVFLLVASEDSADFTGTADPTDMAYFVIALITTLLGSVSVLIGLSLIWSSSRCPASAFASGGRSIWDDQAAQWEKARVAFHEYMAQRHPEELTRDELEEVCCGLVECIDTPTLIDSSLPVLYEDAFGQPMSEEPELRRLKFQVRQYSQASRQRRHPKPGQTQSPPQSA